MNKIRPELLLFGLAFAAIPQPARRCSVLDGNIA